jgi:hypothetical protein
LNLPGVPTGAHLTLGLLSSISVRDMLLIFASAQAETGWGLP